MEFLNGLFADGSTASVIVSIVFALLSLLLGTKWKQVRKEFKEFAQAVSHLIELVAEMPDKPDAAYLKDIKSSAKKVKEEFIDIVEIFKKKE